MAIGAVLVPVVGGGRPVKLVCRSDALVAIEMEPAPAAAVLGTCVEREGECLKATVSDVEQILLKRLDAEGVLHFESSLRLLAPRDVLRLDLVDRPAPTEPGSLSETPDDLVGKVAEHRRL